MKKHRLAGLCRNTLSPLPASPRPGARRAVSAAVWAALSLSLAAPAGAATIVIGTATTSVVTLGNGDALDVTASGSVEPAGGIAIVNASSGITLGGISNAGLISSADNDAIALVGHATVAGDISNSGTVNAVGDGIFIDSQSVVEGSIINEVGGIINGGLANPQDGIELQETSTVNTDIINHGTINAAVDGIQLSWGSRVAGDIVNNGTIDVGGDGIDLTADTGFGPASSVGGDIRNTGQIFAGDDGIDVNTSSVVTGAVVNSGRIEAGSDGIHVSYAAEVQGGISNTATGVIQADGDGIDVSWNGAQAQAISNEGTITAKESGIEVDSTGHIVGAISNSGSITGDFASIFIESGSSVGGGISNSGTLTGPLGIVGNDGLGGGIDVVNSGIIDIGASESIISGDYTQQAGGAFKLTLKNLTDYLDAPLTIVGDAVLADALNLAFVPDFNPAGGIRLTVFDIGGARTGSFANQPQDALVGLFGTVSVYLDYTTEGNIDLYTVPEPGSFALLGVGAFAWRAGRRRLG